MIESLSFRNFQTHEGQDIDLDPHITTLVGDTDAGKSSILRGLRWLSLNRPDGDAFIHWDHEICMVFGVIDGKRLLRCKGKGKNFYKLGKKIYKAFGQKVPEDIASLVNLGEVNFQGQHSLPFWFSSSAGEVSRALNEIVDLSRVDSSLDYVASELRKAKSKLEVADERLQEAESKRDETLWTLEADQELSYLEEQEVDLSQKREKASRLSSLLEEGEKVGEALSDASNAKLDGLELKAGVLSLLDKHERAGKLEDLLDKLADTEGYLCVTKEEVDGKRTELERRTGGRCPLCKGLLKRVK